MPMNAKWCDRHVVNVADLPSIDLRPGKERIVNLLHTAPYVKRHLGWEEFGEEDRDQRR